MISTKMLTLPLDVKSQRPRPALGTPLGSGVNARPVEAGFSRRPRRLSGATGERHAMLAESRKNRSPPRAKETTEFPKSD